MVVYVALLALLGVGVWSAVSFLLPRIRDSQRRLEGGESAADVAQLQESVDELTSQVHQLEEEKDFYRELRSPQDTPENVSESEEEPDLGI